MYILVDSVPRTRRRPQRHQPFEDQRFDVTSLPMESPDMRHPHSHPNLDDVSDDVADDVTISSQMDLISRQRSSQPNGLNHHHPPNQNNHHRRHRTTSSRDDNDDDDNVHEDYHNDDDDDVDMEFVSSRFADELRRSTNRGGRNNPRTLIAGTTMTPSSGYETDRTDGGGGGGGGGREGREEEREPGNYGASNTLLTLDSDFAVVVDGFDSPRQRRHQQPPQQQQQYLQQPSPAEESLQQQQQRLPQMQQLTIQTISGSLNQRPRNPLFTEDTDSGHEMPQRPIPQQLPSTTLQRPPPQQPQQPQPQRLCERHRLEENVHNWRQVRDEFQSQFSHAISTPGTDATTTTTATTTTMTTSIADAPLSR